MTGDKPPVVVEHLEVHAGGKGVVLQANREVRSARFLWPHEVTPIPPNLDLKVDLPPHLAGLERRLGLARRRSPGFEDRMEPSAPNHYESWAESVRQHEIDYEDHPEETVLRELASAAVQEAPQGLWMIQGEPGSGKTTLVERWVELWAASLPRDTSEGVLIPVPVRFRELSRAGAKKKGQRLSELLWENARRGALGGYHRGLYGETRRTSFIPMWFLDGWDEAPSDYQTGAFLDRLCGIPGLKLLTCRTAVLQLLREPAELDRFMQPRRMYTLRDLDPGEQATFLLGRLPQYSDQVTRLHRVLNDHAQMRFITTSPLLLGMIADVAAEAFSTGADPALPNSRAAFYGQAIQRAWSRKLHGLDVCAEDSDARDDLLSRLAATLGLERLAASSRELTAVMKEVGVSDKQDRQRMLGFLLKSGILKSPRDRTCEFVHLTFQEYYLALSLVGHGLRAALNAHWADARYDETLALVISQLVDGGRASEVEEALSSFMEWGEEKHKTDPEYLWKRRRSPLRVTAHLLGRCIGGSRLPKLIDALYSRLQGSEPRIIALAHDPASPGGLLDRLARNWAAELYVAGNPSCPPDVLARLAASHHAGVAVSLARNPSCPAVLLERLAGDYDRTVRRSVASHRNCTADVLARLARDEDKNVRQLVWQNPNCPADLVESLRGRAVGMWTGPPARCRKPARAPEPIGVLDGFTGTYPAGRLGSGARVRRFVFVLEDPSCPAHIRRLVAEDPSCPADALAKLVDDHDLVVRQSVARNPSCPAEALESLARDQDQSVRRWSATHPSCPADVLAKLADDPDLVVRQSVAHNPNTILESV